MCGITGFLNLARSLDKEVMTRVIEKMTQSLGHRGPDGAGSWIEAQGGIALGHRRLSIIDLSSAGAQPMRSASGRYVIVFNGEIYSFRTLRSDLEREGYAFVGQSDTEVLLAAIERRGLKRALQTVHGMFAFAVWDNQKRALSLARDRVGKKPLYYGWCNGTLLFGSELKALKIHPDFDKTIDRDALGQFIQYGWISEPLSIYRSIRKLQPGSFITIPSDGPPEAASMESYWPSHSVVEQAVSQPFTGSFDKAVDQLDELMTGAVTERMIADVDLGALLSGGIDSSAVVGIMQKNSSRPIRTFSIGFEEQKYNEAGYASAVAKHLGTEHHELIVTSRQCMDVIGRLPAIYDEPFGDASQVPTLLVAELARQQVKVVLTGDGGDEIFAGYNHYAEGLAQWKLMSRIPYAARAGMAGALDFVAEKSWHLLKPENPGTGKRVGSWEKAADKLQRKMRGWRARSPQELIASHYSRTSRPESLVPGSAYCRSNLTDPQVWAQGVDPLAAMRHFDYAGYLAGDILVKVDRATMAVGLEARCPILDSRIAEFAWRLPDRFLLDGKGGKRVLRAVLDRYVPARLTDRPKRGFGVPIEDWLRNSLREWVEELLSVERLKADGFFDAAAVRRLWEQHLCHWRNNSNILWSILMFQIWLGNERASEL
ncbi:MAG: asparagine synthase (glutamine-hydrolyzing) [Thiogranum sp.]|nr:asparagine synthase (glutamine-hydrolyzing) [Thiogranum sp.]